MTNRPHRAPARTRKRIDRSNPRFELVLEVESRSPQPGVLSSLLAELKSLGERTGAVLGDAYALAASSILNRQERIADLNAERRFHQRSKAKARVSAGAVEPRTNQLSPPASKA